MASHGAGGPAMRSSWHAPSCLTPKGNGGELVWTLSPWIMAKKQGKSGRILKREYILFWKDSSLPNPTFKLFAWKLPKRKNLFNKRACLKIQLHLSRLWGWGWMFPCQTCDHLVSFCKKLITASADRISPKSSEILSSRKKNDFFFFFFKEVLWLHIVFFLVLWYQEGKRWFGEEDSVCGERCEKKWWLLS